MATNQDAEELWGLLLEEAKELDAEAKVLLISHLDGRAPWESLPPSLKAKLAEWAALMGDED